MFGYYRPLNRFLPAARLQMTFWGTPLLHTAQQYVGRHFGSYDSQMKLLTCFMCLVFRLRLCATWRLCATDRSRFACAWRRLADNYLYIQFKRILALHVPLYCEGNVNSWLTAAACAWRCAKRPIQAIPTLHCVVIHVLLCQVLSPLSETVC